MQLEKFLSVVLPDTGVRFLALNAKKHKPYDDIAKMAKAALAADKNGDAVYFACSSFKTEKYYDESDEKWRSRTQENVLAVKSLWLDIDCGEDKDYPTQAEAVSAVQRFCEEAEYPAPLLVSSGNGLHCYWPLATCISGEQWGKLTAKLRPIYESFDLRFDHSRDCDSASILRAPGTYNRKNPDSPLLVEVLSEGDGEVDMATVVAFIKTHKVVLPSYLKTSVVSTDLSMPEREYAPMDAELLAGKCAQLKFFKDTGGGDYNAWRASIGLLKHCVNGESLIHEWGSKYEGYDAAETQEKFNDWNTAPPTCSAFGDCGSRCSSCPSFGKINSPASLAVEYPEPEVVEVEILSEDGEVIGSEDVQLPHGYTLNERKGICHRLPTKEKTEDGKPVYELVEFCHSFFFPVARIQDADGLMSTQWTVQYPFMGRLAHRTFTVSGKVLGERGSNLHGILSQNELAVPGHHRRAMEDYMAAFMTKLRSEREAIRQYNTFGWQGPNSSPEGFLLGNKLITARGQKPVLTTGRNLAHYASAFDTLPGASHEKWSKIIDRMYNHPQHEQFQFVIYAGFGSALVQFLGEDTGSPINLYGGKGEGKTTCAKLALSIYGDPSKLFLTWKTGTTLNAALKTCAIMKSVPFLFDEFSNADKELSDVLYAFGNGKDKARSDTQGNLRMDGSTWRNINFLTSNASLHEKVSGLKDDASAEITRLLEVHWRNESKLEANTAKILLRGIEPHYGSAAKVYIPWLVENRESVIKMIDAIKESLDRKIGFTKEYRFWSLQLAAVMAGGYIATKLGLLNFSWKSVEAFAIALGKQHMVRVKGHVTPLIESFHHMLTVYGSQIISTREEGDGRAGILEVRIVGEAVGRLVTSQSTLYLSVSAVKQWCRSKSIGFEALREDLKVAGVLVDEGRFLIGKGTNITTGQVNCWKLNWNLISGQSADILQIRKPLVAV